MLKTKTAPYWATLVAGYALCNVLKEYGVQPRQKWINDIYIGDKKAAGILCEAVAQGSQDWLSVGIGVNITECPPDCAKVAGVSREDLLKRLSE